MRRAASLLAAVALAACASAPVVRTAPTPLGLPTSAAEPPRLRADADRSAAPAGAPSPFVHDPAVRALYDSAPPPPAVVEPSPDAEPDRGTAASEASAAGAWRAEPRARRSREPFVPIATIFGAGIGSALSHRGSRAEGALLGAGIGLIFDLQRTVR
jgi:hypothetical protein